MVPCKNLSRLAAFVLLLFFEITCSFAQTKNALPTFKSGCVNGRYFTSLSYGSYSYTNYTGNCLSGTASTTTSFNAENNNYFSAYIYKNSAYMAAYFDFNRNGSYIDKGEFVDLGFSTNAFLPVAIPAFVPDNTPVSVRLVSSNMVLGASGGQNIAYDEGQVLQFTLVVVRCKATFSTDPLPLCQGVPIKVTATTTGTKPMLYEWSGDPLPIYKPVDDTTVLVYKPSAYFALKITARQGKQNQCSYNAIVPTLTTISPPNPPFYYVPADTGFCSGGSVVLSAAPYKDVQPLSYRWLFNGSVIAGATDSVYNASQPGKYTVQVNFKNYPCVTWIGANRTVEIYQKTAAPKPTTSPSKTAAICSGSSQTISASPLGRAYTYQWYSNGRLLKGATGSAYNASLAGQYSVRLTSAGSGCYALSDPVDLMVNAIPAAPVVTPNTDQSSLLLCQGKTAVFTISNFDKTQSYQWYSSKNGPIKGATGQSLSVDYEETFDVEATSASGCISTASNSVTVVTGHNPILVLSPNRAAKACSGQSIQLTAKTDGTLSWYFNNNLLAGFNGNVYSALKEGLYKVVSTNPNTGCAVADSVLVSFSASNFADFLPNTGSVCSGDTLTLFASPSNGIAYTWLFNNVQQTQQTNNYFSATAAGKYGVIITLSGGCKDTAYVNIKSIAKPATPVVSFNGPSAVCPGVQVKMSTSVGVNERIQWYNNGEAIPGATAFTYNTNLASSYYTIAKNALGCASAASKPVATQVYSVVNPPYVYVATQQNTICEGDTATLSVYDTQQLDQKYEWYNGMTLIPNATGLNFKASQSGSYNAIATSNVTGCVSIPSQALEISVNLKPKADAGPNQTVCAGDTVHFKASGGLRYSWSDNEVLSNYNTYNPDAYPDTTTVYYVTVYDTNYCSEIDSVVVRVKPRPAPYYIDQTQDKIFCEGDSMQLRIYNYNKANTYQWYDTNGPIVNAHADSIYVKYGSDFYTIATLNGCTTMSDYKLNLVLVSKPSLTLLPRGNVTVCPGEIVSLATYGAGYRTWTRGNKLIAESGDGYDADTQGIYKVVLNDLQSGCTATDSVKISYTGSNFASFTSNSGNYCTGDSLQLEANPTSGIGYLWLRNTQPFVPAVNSKNFYATQPGNYGVIVTLAGGCMDTVYTDISVLPRPLTPVVSPSGPIKLCYGATTLLKTSLGNGESVQWYNYSQAIPQQVNVQYTAAATGRYSSVTSSKAGCASLPSAAVDVLVYPAVVKPSIGSLSTGQLCEGDTVKLSAYGIDTTLFTFNWYKGAVLLPKAIYASALVTASGRYGVIAISKEGCRSDTSDAISLIFKPLPVGSAGADVKICYGDTVQLNASGGASYYWDDSQSGLFTYSGANPLARPDTTTTYHVTIVGLNGCSLDDSVSVKVGIPIVATCTVYPPKCPYELGAVKVKVKGGQAPFAYLWNDKNAQTKDSVLLIPKKFYSVFITDASNCKASVQQVFVAGPAEALSGGKISPVPPVNYGGDPEPIKSLLPASGRNSSFTYNWEFSLACNGSWTAVAGATGLAYDPPSGIQNITCYRRVASNGTCTVYSDTVSVKLVLDTTATAQIRGGGVKGSDIEIDLTGNAPWIVNYQIKNGDSIWVVISPVITLSPYRFSSARVGEYSILTVNGEPNGIGRVYVTEFPDTNKIAVYNAVSPNADDELNANFTVWVPKEFSPYYFILDVFARDGTQLIEIKGKIQDDNDPIHHETLPDKNFYIKWNAKLKDGSELPNGTYYYSFKTYKDDSYSKYFDKEKGNSSGFIEIRK